MAEEAETTVEGIYSSQRRLPPPSPFMQSWDAHGVAEESSQIIKRAFLKAIARPTLHEGGEEANRRFEE